jgi:3-oxoacyl-[acyl-carrier-protein] synthase III
MNAKIIATGSYLPELIIFNEDLVQFPAVTHSLIEAKTGVKTRRHALVKECTSDLALKAATNCLEKVNFCVKDIDAIILATSSPDRIQPATATRVQNLLGADKCFAFDINSVCSGGIYGLYLGHALVKSGFCRNVLVIAAEIYSRILNPNDFSTFPYFGDGAGALLISQSQANIGIIHTILKTDGSGCEVIQIPAGGTMLPFNQVNNPKDIFFKMHGKKVYEFALDKGVEVVNELIENCNIVKNEIKYIIAHQANINIINELSKRLNIELGKFIVNLDKYGNTAAASVLIALDELIESRKVESGDHIVIVAFGGGLSWGATLLRY